MTLNKLEYSRAYLVGPIDRIAGLGVEWRLDMSAFLWSHRIGVIDPCKKPCYDGDMRDEDASWFEYKKQLKKCGRYEKLHEEMIKIAAFDLRAVDISDFIIMHVDTSVHMCGSYNEQTYASLQRKPILIHCKQGKENVPDWLFGVCKHKEFFSTWDDLKTYIKLVAYTNFRPHKWWKFFDYSKVYNF